MPEHFIFYLAREYQIMNIHEIKLETRMLHSDDLAIRSYSIVIRFGFPGCLILTEAGDCSDKDSRSAWRFLTNSAFGINYSPADTPQNSSV